MSAQTIGLPAARKRPVGHLGPDHPLAEVAVRICRNHLCAGPRVGRIACGIAWEKAIRTDERVVVEEGLPSELDAA